MIRKLHIQNYRCLRDVELNLEPLTVFVGANASGKSSVFSALSSAARNEWREQDRWARNRQAAQPKVSALDEKGILVERTVSVFPLAVFPHSQVLQLELTQLRTFNTLNEMRRLSPNGYGLANVFFTLTRREKDDIAKQFCALVPMYADVDTRAQGGGNHWIVFKDQWRDVWYEPNDVSDGSILLLAFLLIPYQVPPPDIIAIEEPERGLHPYLMDQLVKLLHKLSKGEVGPRPVQVLLATHSAELLEFVDPSEIRFFRRSKDTGETIVEQAPVDDPNWAKTLRTYDSLGDLWLSGGLGGVPGRA